MSFYIISAVGFWALAVWSLQKRPAWRYADFAALAAFILIAGLRYQTGYDWLVYESYMKGVADADYCYQGPPMEPLFWALNAFVSALGGNVQTLFFVIAAFNGILLYMFCRRFAAPFACVAALCFCWIYLPLHMAMLRQSIAVSLFLLAMLAVHSRHFTKAAASSIAAIGFQMTTVLYTPILWQRPWAWIWKHMAIIVVGCVVYTLVAQSPTHAILTFIAQADIPYLSEKITGYLSPATFRHWPKSEIAYFIFNGFFLLLVRKHATAEPTNCLLLCPVLLMFLMQAVFNDFPFLWTRLQALAIPCQAVFIARLLGGTMLGTIQKNMLLFGCMVLSGLALAYRLDRPLMQPYFPYQNSLSAYIKPYSDNAGRRRAEEMYKTVIEHYVKTEAAAGYRAPKPSIARTPLFWKKKQETEAGLIAPALETPCAIMAPGKVLKQWQGQPDTPPTESP